MWNDLDPDVPVQIPLMLSSGNLFYEDRVFGVTTPSGYNKHSAEMFIENVEIYNGRYAELFVEAENEGVVHTNLIITPKPGIYDYVDKAIVARPWGVKDKLWSDGSHVFDTLVFSLHFRKPVSPVAIQDRDGGWSINEDNQTFAFFLKDYIVDSTSFSLNKITMEYRREGEDEWYTMIDNSGYDELSLNFLKSFYDEYIDTYYEPTYPFVWDVSSLDLQDGTYHIRATSFHDNGSFDFSNIYTGTIDLTPPEVIVSRDQPHDGVFSELDVISVEFNEEIDADAFIDDWVTIESTTKTAVEAETHFISTDDYIVHAFSGSIEIILYDDVITDYEGDNLKVTFTADGVKDLVGNALASDYILEFILDYNKDTPSPVEWITDQFLINTGNDDVNFGFEFTGYDVYETTFGLDSMVLEYREEGSNTWNPFYDPDPAKTGGALINESVLTRAELRSNYDPATSSVEKDVLYWVTEEFVDGNYDMRIAVHAGNNVGYSGVISGKIDTTPLQLIEYAPADSVFTKEGKS